MASEVTPTSQQQDVWLPLLQSRLDMWRGVASNDDPQDHLRTIDAELGFLENALSFGKRTRNGMMPACNLPAEVLSHIFALARDVWARKHAEGERTYDIGWICVTHVCSFWRNVALGTPSLWTTIDNCFAIPPGLVPLVQERSSSQPLSLTFDRPTSWGLNDRDIPASMDIWMTETFCSRLRSLKLLNISPEQFEIAWPHFTKFMGHLTHLTLSMDDEGGHNAIIPLPDDICFLIQSSSLHELCLEDCLPFWNPFPFCGTLTSLELIRYFAVNGDFRPTFEHLATVLTSLLSLQQLKLRDIIPEDVPGHCTHPIVLPLGFKSMSYVVQDDVSIGLPFLTHLALPPSSASFIHFSDHSSYLSDEAEVLVTAMPIFYRVGGADVQPVELIVDGDQILIGRCERERRRTWTASIPPSTAYDALYSASPPPGETRVRIYSRSRSSNGRPGPQLLLGHHIIAAPLRSLRAIALSWRSMKDMAANDSFTGLDIARGVRRLGMDLPGSGVLSNELRTMLRESYCVFPSLEIIHVHIGHHNEDSPYCLTEDWETVCMEDAMELADLVKDRKEGGAPLQEIVIEKDMANWAVWDVLRRDVQVTLLDF
ncbi:hypothetical protein PENSPDRAFT_732804 [Peniophora sp. CONT]|nr:hypothetical protein PENSPDRAFT_732804 [Peniophora sp. CONT]